MTVCLTTTVLLIEDDADVLETLANVLELEGYVPLLAVNGRDGMALFETHHPALVITDLLMPEQEGLETIIAMRRLRPDAKIIAISGGGLLKNMDFLDMASKLGATAVMPKPLEPDELVQTVERLLSDDR
jgi:DNA-binding NtrC family response regulator